MKIVSGKGTQTPWIEEAKFAAAHPLIATDIGSVNFGKGAFSTNISTVAARLAIYSGLSEPKELGNEGSQVNALRHVTWQSTITARYGADIAKKIGYAHEENPYVNSGISDFSNVRFNTRGEADQSIDLKNNEIGREIGAQNPKSSAQELALKSLERFHDQGLWVILPQADKMFAIGQQKLTDAEYNAARARLEKLDEHGFTASDPAAKKRLEALEQPRCTASTTERPGIRREIAWAPKGRLR